MTNLSLKAWEDFWDFGIECFKNGCIGIPFCWWLGLCLLFAMPRHSGRNAGIMDERGVYANLLSKPNLKNRGLVHFNFVEVELNYQRVHAGHLALEHDFDYAIIHDKVLFFVEKVFLTIIICCFLFLSVAILTINDRKLQAISIPIRSIETARLKTLRFSSCFLAPLEKGQSPSGKPLPQ